MKGWPYPRLLKRDTFHELFSKIELTKMQNVKDVENLCEQAYHMWMVEFGQYHTISPSLHRAMQHTTLYMEYFQSRGWSLGTTSEQLIEASNFDNKKVRIENSFRGRNLKKVEKHVFAFH